MSPNLILVSSIKSTPELELFTLILVAPVVFPLLNTSDKVSLPKSTISAIVAFRIVLGPLISLNHRVSVAMGTAVFSTAIALSRS